MALMHHPALRVNAEAPDDEAQMAIFHDAGWRKGPHSDTDPDDLAPFGGTKVPRVLPPEDKAVKATTKKGS